MIYLYMGRELKKRRFEMKISFKEAIETLVKQRIESGDDPMELFEELSREANLVFGHYNLEYELVDKNLKAK